MKRLLTSVSVVLWVGLLLGVAGCTIEPNPSPFGTPTGVGGEGQGTGNGDGDYQPFADVVAPPRQPDAGRVAQDTATSGDSAVGVDGGPIPAPEECVRDCGGRQCGPDGCGQTCGWCAPGGSCQAGQCVPIVGDCSVSCVGVMVGEPDGCGGVCGGTFLQAGLVPGGASPEGLAWFEAHAKGSDDIPPPSTAFLSLETGLSRVPEPGMTPAGPGLSVTADWTVSTSDSKATAWVHVQTAWFTSVRTEGAAQVSLMWAYPTDVFPGVPDHVDALVTDNPFIGAQWLFVARQEGLRLWVAATEAEVYGVHALERQLQEGVAPGPMDVTIEPAEGWEVTQVVGFETEAVTDGVRLLAPKPSLSPASSDGGPMDASAVRLGWQRLPLAIELSKVGDAISQEPIGKVRIGATVAAITVDGAGQDTPLALRRGCAISMLEAGQAAATAGGVTLGGTGDCAEGDDSLTALREGIAALLQSLTD